MGITSETRVDLRGILDSTGHEAFYERVNREFAAPLAPPRASV
jgi:hypothetical protein